MTDNINGIEVPEEFELSAEEHKEIQEISISEHALMEDRMLVAKAFANLEARRRKWWDDIFKRIGLEELEENDMPIYGLDILNEDSSEIPVIGKVIKRNRVAEEEYKKYIEKANMENSFQQLMNSLSEADETEKKPESEGGVVIPIQRPNKD